MTAEQLQAYFENVDDNVKQFAFDTIDEYVFFSEKLAELKKLPLIQVNPKNPEMQRPTAAGKMIKEYSQVLDAKRGTLLRILYKIESNAADELMQKLSEFE